MNTDWISYIFDFFTIPIHFVIYIVDYHVYSVMGINLFGNDLFNKIADQYPSRLFPGRTLYCKFFYYSSPIVTDFVSHYLG